MHIPEKGHIHFVGIGGIGMSGIAYILQHLGYYVSGCDVDIKQTQTNILRASGCTLQKNDASFVCAYQAIDLMVYSSAISTTHPDLQWAIARGISVVHRATILAYLMKNRCGIAIAGSHGKTTTSALIAHILIQAGRDPSVIVGGIIKNIQSNVRFGKSAYLIAEADESDRSFLQLQPVHAVVTNIDREHVETYHDIHEITDTFKKFLHQLPPSGTAYVCIDDIQIQSILPTLTMQTITYGLSQHAHIRAHIRELAADYSHFSIWEQNQERIVVTLPLLGTHNVLNALAATAVARNLNISFSVISAALSSFKGTERRFSYRGTYKHAEIFEDYGHHPTEIACTLTIAKQRAKERLCVIFQPHRYSRTQGLWNEFINTFLSSPVDQLIITDIYAAHESEIPGISSKNMVQQIKTLSPDFPVVYVSYDNNFQSLIQSIQPLLQPDNLILLQGAGTIHTLLKYLIYT